MDELFKLIATALKVPVADIGPATSMQTTSAWDSLSHMDLVLSIEAHYQIMLEADEIAAMTSAAAIVAQLTRRGLVRHEA
jgi:acyl carrier protein